MAIKVFDFRTVGKLSANCYDALVNNATFVMMIDHDGTFKEFTVTIPKRYHFITLTQPREFISNKAKEYDVLKDFVVDNKQMLCDKWKLNDREYEELLDGLQECLILEYGKFSKFMKSVLSFPISLKRFIRKMFGGMRVW